VNYFLGEETDVEEIDQAQEHGIYLISKAFIDACMTQGKLVDHDPFLLDEDDIEDEKLDHKTRMDKAKRKYSKYADEDEADRVKKK
jgi:hypothetical protein